MAIDNTQLERETPGIIKLPEAQCDGKLAVETALKKRRSVRVYSYEPLSLTQASQLLWAAQGITGSYGMRAAPSAGALYPLEVYLVAGKVDGFPPGIYRYDNECHQLIGINGGDQRSRLSGAALGQECIRDAPASIVIAAIYGRTAVKYGDRAIRYVHMEVGAVTENIYLQAESLDMGTVFVGAFHDDRVKNIMTMPSIEEPLAIMPIGKSR